MSSKTHHQASVQPVDGEINYSTAHGIISLEDESAREAIVTLADRILALRKREKALEGDFWQTVYAYYPGLSRKKVSYNSLTQALHWRTKAPSEKTLAEVLAQQAESDQVEEGGGD